MGEKRNQDGTPVTQEFVFTLLFGYFVLGPIALGILVGVAWLIGWAP